MVLRGRGARLDLTWPGRSVEVRSVKSPLEGLRDEMRRFRAYQSPGVAAFSSAAQSAFSPTISCVTLRRLPSHAHDELGTPDLYLMLTDTVLIFDNVRQTLKIVANVAVEDYPSTGAAYRAAASKVDELIARLDAPAKAPRLDSAAANLNGDAAKLVSNQTREGYMAMVEAAKEYIAAGDVIQVVPSQRFEAPLVESSVQPVPQPAHDQSFALHVLPAARRSHAGRRVARGDGAGGGARYNAPADRGDASAWGDRGRRPRA